MLTNFKDTVQRAFQAINPFYRNPIQVAPDFQNLETTPYVLHSQDVAIDYIKDIFYSRRAVRGLLRDLYGQYCMKVVVVEGDQGLPEIRTNLYRLASDPSIKPNATTSTAGWRASGIYHYLVEVDRKDGNITASIRPLKHELSIGSIDPFDPIQSWVIPLEMDELRQLGLIVS